MKPEKRVVDLIYISPPKSTEELLKEYRLKIDIWGKKLKEIQEYYFEQSYDTAGPDMQEVLAMRKFLNQFLKHRIDWIEGKITDSNLKKRYLQVLPPFHQKGAVKALLFHFFQLKESQDKKQILFKAATPQEKEVRILWDIYKLRKTIESIRVLRKACQGENPFDSIFAVPTRIKRLDELERVFKLMFQMVIRPEHQKELFNSLSPKHITGQALIERSEKGVQLIYPHVLEKFNYRNHFFFVYFYSGMKAKVGGEVREFRFNYLDFEIIKQEFLTHWLKEKLQGNPQKDQVYRRYKLGEKNLADVIAAEPDKEIEILQQLPYDVFNDITAEVNESVASEQKVAVETFSENHGEFAEVRQQFEKAKKLAKQSLDKIKVLVGYKEPQVEAAPEPKPEPPPEPAPEPEAPKETRWEVVKLKKNEIDFPYFVKAIADFSKRLNQIRAKMGPDGYKEFSKQMHKLLSHMPESSMIQRRTPKHEWVLPYLIKEYLGDELVQEHFLVLGAEVKSKSLGMGYSAKSGQNAYQFTSYFALGCAQEDPELGAPADVRKIRGKEFHEYNPLEAKVRERMEQFFELIRNP